MTLKRFFVFHFLFPFLKLSFVILHIFNLHFLSSNNPLSWGTNNKIPFLPFIISKDFYGNILILYLYFLLIYFGFSSFSHPDNALEGNIVWRFLKNIHGGWVKIIKLETPTSSLKI